MERVNQYFKSRTERFDNYYPLCKMFAIYFMYITEVNSLSLKYDTTSKKIYFINELSERGEYFKYLRLGHNSIKKFYDANNSRMFSVIMFLACI